MEKIVFNIDSRFRNIQKYPNPEFFALDLYETQKNIDFFRVTSLEIPVIYFVFSDIKDNDKFRIRDISGSWQTVQIATNYYNVSDLITELNTKLDAIFGIGVFVFSDNGIGNLTLTRTTPGSFELDFTNTTVYKSLGYHLGFRKDKYTVTSTLIKPEAICDVHGENYCFLRVNDYGQFHLNPFNGTKALYKVVISLDRGIVSFIDSSDLVNKTHIFRQPVNLRRLEFELLDVFGNRIDNRGIDYSITVEMGQIYNKDEYMKKLDPFRH